jgi:hypothetical protein
MLVTYKIHLPLDGLGTSVHPAYKWIDRERNQFCHHITKAGECYYMMTREGWVICSIEPKDIVRITFADMVVSVKHNRLDTIPFHASFDKNGEHYSEMGSIDFSGILESINQYNNIYNRRHATIYRQ